MQWFFTFSLIQKGKERLIGSKLHLEGSSAKWSSATFQTYCNNKLGFNQVWLLNHLFFFFFLTLNRRQILKKHPPYPTITFKNFHYKYVAFVMLWFLIFHKRKGTSTGQIRKDALASGIFLQVPWNTKEFQRHSSWLSLTYW